MNIKYCSQKRIFRYLLMALVFLCFIASVNLQTTFAASEPVVNVPGVIIYSNSNTRYARTTSDSGTKISTSLTTQHFNLSNLSSITIKYADASNKSRGDWVKKVSNSHKAYAVIDGVAVEIGEFEHDVTDLNLAPFKEAYGNLVDVYWTVSGNAIYYNLWKSTDYYNDGLTVGLSVSVGKIYGPSFTSNLPIIKTPLSRSF